MNGETDYSVEEWLDIFDSSTKDINFISLVSSEIANITTYCDNLDVYLGFCFLETLNSIMKNDPVVKDLDMIKNTQIVPSGDFMVQYIMMLHIELLSSKTDWGTSIYSAWLADYEIENGIRAGYIKDYEDIDLFNKENEHINPVLNTTDSYINLFRALLVYYNKFLKDLGEETYLRYTEECFNNIDYDLAIFKK